MKHDSRLKYLLGILVVILILLQFRLWSGPGSLADISRLRTEIKTQESDNAVLQDRNQSLRQEVSDLKTGQDAIEERARSELGMVRKGETLYLIVDKDKTDAADKQDQQSK